MVNIGIIGAGRIGQVHVKSILSGIGGAKIRAIADPYMKDDVAAWARSVGIDKVGKDHMEILRDPAIDAVLICSSTDTHSPISLQAIQAGKHVFCEKPIDHDLGRIKQVIDALEGTGLKYQVGFQRRFDHNFRALRRAVTSGEIGELNIVKITSRDPEPPPLSYIKVSGGLFLDMMIHDFDMVRYLSGAEATEIFANAAVLVDPAIGEAGDVDTAIVTMKLSNGAIAVIDDCRRAVYGHDQRGEVLGSKGAAITANDAESNMLFFGADGVVGEKPMYFFLERYLKAYQDEIRSFIDAIENDTDTEVNANDGLQPVRMGLAAWRSVRENRPVKLSEITL